MQNAPLGSFCNTFDLHSAIIVVENQVFVFFLRGRLRQVLLFPLGLHDCVFFCLECPPVTVTNGAFSGSREYNSQADIICNEGYVGDAPIECQTDATWGPIPTCDPIGTFLFAFYFQIVRIVNDYSKSRRFFLQMTIENIVNIYQDTGKY